MWEKYELKLLESGMSVVGKFAVWLVFFEWVELLIIIGVGMSLEIILNQFFTMVISIGIIWSFGVNIKYTPLLEAWVYLKNFCLNKPKEIHYYIPDNVEDREDKSQWIYKY